MTNPSDHQFTFPTVRPVDAPKTPAPIHFGPAVSQRQLVEQSVLRRPSRNGRPHDLRPRPS
jgi:hypothetical protein